MDELQSGGRGETPSVYPLFYSFSSATRDVWGVLSAECCVLSVVVKTLQDSRELLVLPDF